MNSGIWLHCCKVCPGPTTGNNSSRRGVFSGDPYAHQEQTTSQETRFSRRSALRCLAYGGAGTLFTLAGGTFIPSTSLPRRAALKPLSASRRSCRAVIPTIGFNKEANPDVAATQPRRFGSVTVLNGHIHQIVQKVEGNITFHTARSTAYPQPVAGEGAGPAPLKVPADQLPGMLGVTSVSVVKHPSSMLMTDTTLA
jgi:hypothetical protein